MRRVSYVVLVLLISLFTSCWQENTKATKPRDLIPKEQLKLLMIDIYLAESANNMRMLEKDTTLPTYAEFYKAVLEKHQVTAENYENSLKYYSEDPEEINAIYDDVLQRLTKMESELGGEVEHKE